VKRVKAILFSVVVLAVGIFMTFAGVKEYKNSKRIQKEGKQIIGKVTDSEERRGRRGRRSYYLTVQFQPAQQQPVEQELKVSYDVYSKATSTGTVVVHYLPSDPSICAFGAKAETKFGTTVWGVIALVVSLVLFKGAFESGDDGGEVAASSSHAQVAQNEQTNSGVETAVSDSDDSLEEAA